MGPQAKKQDTLHTRTSCGGAVWIKPLRLLESQLAVCVAHDELDCFREPPDEKSGL